MGENKVRERNQQEEGAGRYNPEGDGRRGEAGTGKSGREKNCRDFRKTSRELVLWTAPRGLILVIEIVGRSGLIAEISCYLSFFPRVSPR